MKTQVKAPTHSTLNTRSTAFQTRPFAAQNESTVGEEHEGSSLFESYLQKRAAGAGVGAASALPSRNPSAGQGNTGLPDQLKTGIESLSGVAMDEVRVHYNSAKPTQFQALAYTEGTDIHVAPGQERHLPHEAWHVVQQMEGRVRPTMQMKGVGVNDDAGLEREADVMGGRALQLEKTKQNQSRRMANSAAQTFGDSQPEVRTQNSLQFVMLNNQSQKKQITNKSYGAVLQPQFSVAGAPPKAINVEEEDANGGHTRERHIGKDDKFLIDRAPTLPQRMASSYVKQDVAEKMTHKSIVKNWQTIKNDWSEIRQPNRSYRAPLSGPKHNYKILDSKSRELEADEVEVWLHRIRDANRPVPNEVHVMTSYPTTGANPRRIGGQEGHSRKKARKKRK